MVKKMKRKKDHFDFNSQNMRPAHCCLLRRI
jgi:hypothetical protein